MQATARMASVVSSTLPARRRLIRDVWPTQRFPMEDDVPELIERSADDIAKRSLAVYAVVAHSKGQAWVGE